MTTFLIVRHGQSVANELGILAGVSDYDLTELGHKQAEKTAEYIAENYNVDAIYTSPLNRAMQTAQHTANKLGMRMRSSLGLCEIDAGDWDGKPWDDLAVDYPEEYGVWKYDIGKSHCPGGENPSDVQERVIQTLMEIAEQNPNKTVAVFSHAMAIRCAEALWRSMNIEDLKDIPWVTNASVTIVEYDDKLGFRLIQRSIDGHLGDFSTKLPANC